MNILLVEDDRVLAEVVKTGLEAVRYHVDVAADGERGLLLAREGGYGLVVLDLMLPRRDGWSVCQALRSCRNGVPILMLTARDEVEDRVRGFDAGADDYLVKPFDFRELLARVRGLLRRDRMHRARVIRVADLEIDTTAGRVWRAGCEVHLTPREYTLLEALAAPEGRVLSREMIHERIWHDEDSFSDTVNVRVASLRKKIDAAHEIKLICTIHGMGYMLRDPNGEGGQ